MGLLNFPIRCIIHFVVEKKLFSIYTIKGVGSFSTPGLDTCTLLEIERKQGLRCYSLGALGLGCQSIVVHRCIRGFRGVSVCR